MNYLLPERLDRLARRRFERVLRHSAAATLAVGVWQERLATLQRKVPALEPREAVWRGLEQGSEALPASYVGLLTDAAGQPSVLASSRRQGRQLTVKMLRPIVVPAGSVAMLWALPKDGAAAFPIGVVPASGSAIIGLGAPSERLFSNVSRLAVSIEPGPAKAGDRPSGEFVLTGHCVKLW